ncbi:uncharacterized protein LOC128993618 [Macrosteles quadrilineatus]|uniref:uncharacterized protein LOC128993618 n=1 Tax=Macrosteles quadrilineatus TaxID=74068 RepID=UPI0023E0E10D|nr:uncharacterized protein LOC128993618 [Macrosteles quadrilineatus]
MACQATVLCVFVLCAFTLAQNSTHNITGIKNKISQRIVNQALRPVTLRVNPQTSLYVRAGQVTTLYFDATNNNDWNAFFAFYCDTTSSTVQSVQPYERWISRQETATIRVVIRTGNVAATSETVTFTAVTYSSFGENPTMIKTYLFAGQQQVSDSTSPQVSYTINGDCRYADTPSTCNAATWGFQANIQDSTSGLLSVETVPTGFEFTSDFIAGTRDQMSGRYTNSCCYNKVDLIATDLNGNQFRTSIDIYNVWLSPGAIVAIVVGSILLLLIIILICCAVGYCIRRRRKTSTFTMNL